MDEGRDAARAEDADGRLLRLAKEVLSDVQDAAARLHAIIAQLEADP